MKKLIRYLAPFWWQIILLLVGLALQVWSSLQLPSIMADIVNKGIVQSDQEYILNSGMWMLLVALVGGVGMVIAGFFASRVGTGFSRNVRSDIFRKILSFSLPEMNKFSTASLVNRTTNDIQQLQMTVVMVLRMSLQAPMMGVGAIIAALNTAPSMAWIIALAVGILVVLATTIIIIVMPKFRIVQKLTDKLNQVTREALTGLRVVRAFNNEKYEEKRFVRANDDVAKVQLFTARAMSVMMPLVQLVFNCITLLVIWVGAHYIDEGVIAVGDMMAFMQYAIQVIMSFMFLTVGFILVPRAAVSWQRISEVMNTKLSIRQPKHAKRAKSAERGTVEFRDVTFAYEGAEHPVLRDISFVSKPGQTTAIIGATGSGKSTIASLIPRLYDVTSGEVLVDGIDVRNYEKHDLMKKIGYIPQRAVLFSGTVQSNIGFGTNDSDLKNIRAAAKVAQAKSFVEDLDKKYESRVSQGGNNFSGGQKQRLAIARAVARDPEVYVFDDSFSALDFRTDLALRQALHPVTREATVLVVAQRVGTIKHADQILVLDKGRIVGTGKHYELLRECKVYREIASSQLSESEMKDEMKIAKKGGK